MSSLPPLSQNHIFASLLADSASLCLHTFLVLSLTGGLYRAPSLQHYLMPVSIFFFGLQQVFEAATLCLHLVAVLAIQEMTPMTWSWTFFASVISQCWTGRHSGLKVWSAAISDGPLFYRTVRRCASRLRSCLRWRSKVHPLGSDEGLGL